MLLEFRKKKSHIHNTAFVHPTAVVMGDVSLGENSGVWSGAVIRGDFAGVMGLAAQQLTPDHPNR